VGDPGKVIAWQAELIRPVGVDLPAGVRIGRNGWSVVDAEDMAGWLILDDDEGEFDRQRPGAGLLIDADARRAIEMHAVQLALAWCGEHGWQDATHVGDAGESFDIRGTVEGSGAPS
jgi:hypothetical protein